MQKRHQNRKQYFEELAISSRDHFIPYLESFRPLSSSSRILEIGCGDGGNLLPFAEKGCEVTGIDLDKTRIQDARQFFEQAGYQATLDSINIFDMNFDDNKYDVILIHDVIEHIYEKANFLNLIKKAMHPESLLFIGFPAWQMPFGGHQQICKSKFCSHMPFYHILPKSIYHCILKISGENQGCINELLSIKSCSTTIEGFEKLAKQSNYRIIKRKLWFINPHYEVKFKLKPRVLSPVLSRFPYVRNFFSTSCFYLLKLNNKETV